MLICLNLDKFYFQNSENFLHSYFSHSTFRTIDYGIKIKTLNYDLIHQNYFQFICNKSFAAHKAILILDSVIEIIFRKNFNVIEICEEATAICQSFSF